MRRGALARHGAAVLLDGRGVHVRVHRRRRVHVGDRAPPVVAVPAFPSLALRRPASLESAIMVTGNSDPF